MQKALTSYDILNCDMQASQKDIEAAYRRLAMAWHPDKHQHNGQSEVATRNFKLLQEAYQNLKTPETRSAYNHKLARKNRSIIVSQNKVMNDNKPLSSLLNALERILGKTKGHKQ